MSSCPVSSCARKETVDIDILVTSMVTKNSCNQNNKWTSLKNKEVEPVEPVQMDIYQSNTYVKKT